MPRNSGCTVLVEVCGIETPFRAGAASTHVRGQLNLILFFQDGLGVMYYRLAQRAVEGPDL